MSAQTFENKLNDFMNEQMDRSLPLMTKIFECSANCTRNATTNEQASGCLTQCHKPLEELEAFRNAKLQSLMSTIQNCQNPCMKLVKGNDISEAEACANKCFETHMGDLDSMMASISKFQNSL